MFCVALAYYPLPCCRRNVQQVLNMGDMEIQRQWLLRRRSGLHVFHPRLYPKPVCGWHLYVECCCDNTVRLRERSQQ